MDVGSCAMLGGSASLTLPGGLSLDPEIDLFGFYVPYSMIVVLAGFLLAWLLAWLMDWFGLTRFVWHPPLFLFAMMIGCSAGLALWLFPR